MKNYTGLFKWNGTLYELHTRAKHNYGAMWNFCQELSKIVGVAAREIKSYYSDVTMQKQYIITQDL
jgi:hypothetical protein